MRLLIGLFASSMFTLAFSIATLVPSFDATNGRAPSYFVSRKYKIQFRIPEGFVLSVPTHDLPALLTPRDESTKHGTPGDLMIQAFAAEGGSGTPSLQAWGKSLVPIGTENLEALDLTNTTCAQCPHRVAYRAVYVDRVYGDPIENVKLFLDDGGVRVCFYLSYWKDNHQGRRYWETLTELARSVKATTQTQSPRGEH